mgnify:CR=1 FL=1|tara:strand:+ start:147 stop:1262 length:1116 start_codon:yes stop_codon:yes gene_type:complete
MPAPKIKIKRSSVAGKVPHYPNTLDLGEFAINTADGKVFIAAGVNGVGVGTTVREVGISTENLLSQSLRVDGDTDLNGDLSVSDVASFNHAKFVGVLTSTSFHGNINSTGISTIAGFRFPSSDGTEDQALVTDGSGSLSFKTLSGGGGGATGAATTISAGVTTATAGQTVFTTPHPHNDGTDTFSHQVFLNGLKMRPGGAGASTRDFVSSSNSTITFDSGLNLNDEVRCVVYFGHTFDEEFFTATAGQTLFALSGSLSAQKNFKVYVNGVKLRNGADYGVSAPVSLTTACEAGDHVEITCDNAEDQFTATQGQTNFTPTNTDISASNMQVFHNGLILNQTEDFTIGSPSVALTDGAGLDAGDHVDIVIRRS